MPQPRLVTDPDIIAQVRAAVAAQSGQQSDQVADTATRSSAAGSPSLGKLVTDPAIIERVRRAAAAQGRIEGAFSAAADQPKTSAGRAALEGAGDAAAFGFGDDIGAALDLPVSALASGKAGETYRRNLAVRRAAQSDAQEDAPGSYLAGQVGGALLTTPLVPQIAPLRAAGWTGRAAEAGYQGLATAGLYGAGTAEGGIAERARGAAESAPWGAAGLVASPLIDVAGAAVRGGRDLVRRAAQPFTGAGREQLAADTLAQAASDPTAARQALQDGASELVPGSQPTTFQQSGDMGLGALERSVSTKNPAEFMQRRGEQNAARLAAMEGIQPGGHPQAVAEAFRSRLAAIDEETDLAVTGLQDTAAGRARALGGQGTPDGYGESLRASLSSAETAARTRERELWKAVDPSGSLALGTDNVKREAQSIRQQLAPTARPMEGEEAALFKVVGQLQPAIKFTHMSALRSRIGTAMRQELFANGRSPVYARLSALRGAVESDLEGIVARRVAEEAEAVASGAMRQEETVAARIREWQSDWESRQATEAAGGDHRGSARGYAGSRATSVPGLRGTASEAGERLGGAEGDPRLSGDAVQPNFDDEALGRLRTASAATKARAETFDRGAPGRLLKRSGQGGPYAVPTAVVPERIFQSGAKGGASVQEYRRAVGDGEAMTTLRDYAASSLRRVAEKPDGTLDPGKVNLWRRAHSEALRAFPDLDRQIADAGAASQLVADAAVARRTALDDYQKGLIGRLVDAQDAEDITRRIGAIFGRQDSVALMRRLVVEMRGDTAAREGARKAVVDHMLGRLVGNTEAATTGRSTIKSDQFQTFVRQNRPSLRLLFSEHEMTNLQAIADDLQRSNLSIASVKLPGGSNTAQDMLAAGDGGATLLGRIVQGTAAASGFAASGGFGALAGWLGIRAVTQMRQAGVQKVDDLIRDAMLDPGLARILLTKARIKPDRGPAAALGTRYSQLASRLPAMATAGQGEQPAR